MATLQGSRILVIDDSNVIRKTAELFLSEAGCHVVLAEDGFLGLARLAESEPSLVLADIGMPRLDGFETCALIKRSGKYRNTPVVMLTARDGLFDRARARLCGCDGYLVKPFTKDGLLKIATTLVARA